MDRGQASARLVGQRGPGHRDPVPARVTASSNGVTAWGGAAAPRKREAQPEQARLRCEAALPELQRVERRSAKTVQLYRHETRARRDHPAEDGDERPAPQRLGLGGAAPRGDLGDADEDEHRDHGEESLAGEHQRADGHRVHRIVRAEATTSSRPGSPIKRLPGASRSSASRNTMVGGPTEPR